MLHLVRASLPPGATMSTSCDLLKTVVVFTITAVFVFFLLVQTHAAVTGHLTVEWDLSTDPEVIGYVVDYGGSPGGYTAQQDAGYATTLTVSIIPLPAEVAR